MNVAAYPLNVLSLCSGAGGLELGVHIAEPRARTVCYVEREAYAAATLVARMEDQALDNAPVWDDVATFDATAWRGCVDIVTSGDPCQPNSVAGNRKGTGDDRWLLDRVLEIFDQSGAHTFFRENVPGNADGQLGVLVPALERMGCTVAAGIFSAAEVGASHRRERLFVMAHRGHAFGRACDAGGHHAHGTAAGRPQGDDGAGERGQDVADSLRLSGGQRPRRERVLDGGETVGDAQVTDGRGQQQAETAWRGRGGPAGTGEAVADASEPGLQGRERPGASGKRDGAAASGSIAELREIPLFAPGPADPRWPAILEGVPHLEPAVRRVADGLAHRVDRLRLTGNGVFPLAAGYAYRTLDALLADARASEPVLMENSS